MYRSVIERYEQIFLRMGPQKFGIQKLPIFDDFANQWQLWGPVSPARSMILYDMVIGAKRNAST